LIGQIRSTISIFKYSHLNYVAVFIFDQSSAHEEFAEDALNINNMNVNLGGKLRDTVIPLNNLGSAPGKDDTYRHV